MIGSGSKATKLALAAVLSVAAACGEPTPGESPDSGIEAADAALASDASDASAGGDAAAPGIDAAAPGADAAAPGPDAARPPALYPADRTQSPLTAEVAANLRTIAARGARAEDVFAKVGDSNTVNTNYFACFAGANVDLAGRSTLQPALTFFEAGLAGTTTPFDRVSLAATVGWSAWAVLAGSPSPLAKETTAVQPRYATVMFGTNDIQARDVYRYGENLFDVADQLIAGGTIPIFSAIPPRDDDAAADLWVPRYNAVARGIAQSRQVPFVDLHRELLPLPSHGLGADGLHLNVYLSSGAARGCVLTSAGLQYGHNVRNLVTLTALARARDAVAGQPAPDGPAAGLAGEGRLADPFVIPSLPFTDVRDTSQGGFSRLSQYSGCASGADESGREFLYKLVLTRTTNLRAFVIDRGGADIDVHLLGSAADAASCIERHDQVIARSVAAGTYYLSLDTYVSAGAPLAGEYLLVVLED